MPLLILRVKELTVYSMVPTVRESSHPLLALALAGWVEREGAYPEEVEPVPGEQ